MSEVLARLTNLEAKVESLRLASAQSEALTPNYLTIDPATGLVSASFTGVVNALGLVLPAGSSVALASVNSVQWVRQSDGTLIAYIQGYDDSAGGFAGIVSKILASAINRQTSWDLVAQGGSGEFAELVIQARRTGDPEASTKVSVITTSGEFPVMDAALGSAFVRAGDLPTSPPAAVRLVGGSSSVTWPGASRVSSTTAIPHGLLHPVNAPLFAGAVALGTTNANISIVSTDATNVNVAGNTMDGTSPAAGTSRNLFWFAVG